MRETVPVGQVRAASPGGWTWFRESCLRGLVGWGEGFVRLPGGVLAAAHVLSLGRRAVERGAGGLPRMGLGGGLWLMRSSCAGLRTDRSCRTWGGADAGECTGRGSLGRERVWGVASCGMGSVLSGLSSRPLPRPVAHTRPVREAKERSLWLLEGRWWEAAMAWAETAHNLECPGGGPLLL